MPASADTFDPASPTMAVDRFDVLAALRATSPVVYVQSIHMWAVTGHAATREVLADPIRFPSGGTYLPSQHLPADSFDAYPEDDPLWRHAMVSADGETHRRLRTAMTRAFAVRRVRLLEPDIAADAEHLVGLLLADSDQAEQADVFAGFVRPLPSRTIARFFGLPVAEGVRCSRWSDAFVVPQVPGLPVEAYVQSARQFAEFDAYIRRIITGDLDELGEGIILDLVTGSRDGTHDLTEDELVEDIANVVLAGHETTVSSLSNMFARLLADRSLWARLAEADVDLPPLVEELLRLDTAGIGLFRAVPEATSIAGVDVPAGAKLWVAFGAANRDP